MIHMFLEEGIGIQSGFRKIYSYLDNTFVEKREIVFSPAIF